MSFASHESAVVSGNPVAGLTQTDFGLMGLRNNLEGSAVAERAKEGRTAQEGSRSESQQVHSITVECGSTKFQDAYCHILPIIAL